MELMLLPAQADEGPSVASFDAEPQGIQPGRGTMP